MRRLMTTIRQIFKRKVQEERANPAPILSIEDEARRILKEFDEKRYNVPTVLMILCSAYGQHLGSVKIIDGLGVTIQDLENKFLELCVKERIYKQAQIARFNNNNVLH